MRSDIEPYRILYLHHTGRFAGAENSLLHLTTHLDRSRFTPMFLCPSVGEFPERLGARGIPVIHHVFGANSQILRLLKNYDLLKEPQMELKLRPKSQRKRSDGVVE